MLLGLGLKHYKCLFFIPWIIIWHSKLTLLQNLDHWLLYFLFWKLYINYFQSFHLIDLLLLTRLLTHRHYVSHALVKPCVVFISFVRLLPKIKFLFFIGLYWKYLNKSPEIFLLIESLLLLLICEVFYPDSFKHILCRADPFPLLPVALELFNYPLPLFTTDIQQL